MANYDQSIVDAIERKANTYNDPSKRQRYGRAALQIGIVESGIQNLNYGDADSKNFRQERESVYGPQWAKTGGALNTNAIVDRLFSEFEQHDKGQPSWQLAADVQRPAAQYRGRYHDVAGEAAKLFGGGPASSPSPSGRTSAAGAAEQVASSAPTLQSGEGGDYVSVLSGLLGQQQPQQPVSSGLAAPGFMSRLARPQGFRPIDGSGALQQQAPSADLSLLETLRGSGTGVDPGTPVATAAGAPAKPQRVVDKVIADRKSRGFAGSGVLELIYNGGNNGQGYGIKDGQVVDGSAVFSNVWDGHKTHVHVAAGPRTVVELGKLAQQMGLHVGENPKFGGVDPVHVAGSYHYKGEAIDVSGDAKKMAKFATAVEAYNKTHRL